MYSGNPDIRTLPVSATWAHNRHQEPTATEDRPAPRRVTPVVGKRTELARYQVTDGERIIYGQRVDGIARFLGTMADVIVLSSSRSEDSACRAREGS